MTYRITHSWKERLLEGYKAFRAGDYSEQKTLYEKLGTKGQNPRVMLIACADSRVDPTDIFNAYPGEMFVVRNVANIVPPVDENESYHGTASAIEYAVSVLKVEVIVVMGHESCGGIQGCLDGLGHDPDAGYVGRWVSIMNGARDRVLAMAPEEDKVSYELELEGVRQSLANLRSYPFVKKAMETGQLELQGAYFSIISARLMLADAEENFHLVSEK